MGEESLAMKEFQVERKTIRLSLNANARGRFLRITEATSGKRSAVIIPDTGLAEFGKALAEMMRAAEGIEG
jgi:hypothetical protein